MISVFRNLNKLSGKYIWLDWLAIFFARAVLYVLVVTAFLIAFADNYVTVFWYAFLAGFIAAFILNSIISFFYPVIRPDVLKKTRVLIPVPEDYSFPSDHTAFLFGFSFFLLIWSPALAIVLLVLSFLVGIARVYCGVHYFKDVLGGMISGAICAIGMLAVYWYF